MAGGRLVAAYQAGKLRAWFCATADFLINWQPFSYDIEMSVRIGVAYRVSFLGINKDLTVELSAAVQMWGPPFGGKARISWFVISFDISFGVSQQTKLEKIGWEAFQKSFLPAPEAGADPAVATIRIASGLIREQEVTKGGRKSKLRVVNAHELSFVTESLLPATSVLLNNKPVETIGVAAKPVGIRPMDVKALTSVHAVTFGPRQPSQGSWDSHLKPTLLTRSVPDALWSNKGLSRVQKPSAEMIEAVPNGVGVALQKREPTHGLPPVELARFKYLEIPKGIAWKEWQPPAPIPAPDKWTLANTIWGNPTVDAARKAILSALGREKAEIHLLNLAANHAEIFQSEPSMARLGEPFKYSGS